MQALPEADGHQRPWGQTWALPGRSRGWMSVPRVLLAVSLGQRLHLALTWLCCQPEPIFEESGFLAGSQPPVFPPLHTPHVREGWGIAVQV